MEFDDAARKWDDRYRKSQGLLFGEQANGWLTANAHWLSPASDIVCVADGEGRNSTWLAAHGHRVSAFDVSSVAIDRLHGLAAERGVSVDARVASLADWLWPADSLDAVVAIFIQFAGPTARHALFADMAQALRPGGVLIIEGYGPRQMRYRTGGPGVLENLYTLPMIIDAFSGWQILASREVDQDLAEGTAHVGRSHLVSAVLKRPASSAHAE